MIINAWVYYTCKLWWPRFEIHVVFHPGAAMVGRKGQGRRLDRDITRGGAGEGGGYRRLNPFFHQFVLKHFFIYPSSICSSRWSSHPREEQIHDPDHGTDGEFVANHEFLHSGGRMVKRYNDVPDSKKYIDGNLQLGPKLYPKDRTNLLDNKAHKSELNCRPSHIS